MIEKRKVALLLPYYRQDEEVFVFLQKRDKNAKRLPDFFGFFGGGIEEGESPEEAVKREVKEELSIDVSNHEHFTRYEFYSNTAEVYIMKVEKNFSDKVKVLEGDYGRFFTEDDVVNEKKMIPEDKLILRNFFGIMKRDDPFL